MDVQLAAKMPQSKIELLETATIRLLKDLKSLQEKMNDFYQGSSNEIVNFRNYDDKLNNIITELNSIKASYSLSANATGFSDVEFLTNQLTIIKDTSQKLSKILSDARSQRGIVISNEFDLPQKIQIDTNIKRLQERVQLFQEITNEMREFVQSPLHYGKASDLKLVKRSVSAMRKTQLSQYIKIAHESDQLDDNTKNYLDLKKNISEQKKKVELMKNSLNDFQKVPELIQQIQENKEEFQYITKTVNTLNGSAESAPVRVQFNHLNKSMNELEKIYEKAQIEAEEILPTIATTAEQVSDTAIKLLQSARNEKTFVDNLGDREELDKEFKYHMDLLTNMSQNINNILYKQNEIESIYSMSQPLSQKNLQDVIVGLSDMYNMTKFSTHVGKRIDQLEQAQVQSQQKIQTIFHIAQSNDNDLSHIRNVLSKQTTQNDANESYQNEVSELQEMVEQKFSQALKLKENHGDCFGLISEFNKKIKDLSIRVDELEVRNSEKVVEALKLNEELESTALQNYTSTKNEIMSVSRSLKNRFESLENEIIQSIRETRKQAKELTKPRVDNEQANKKVKAVIADLADKIQKRSKSLADQAKLDKVKNAISSFDKNSASKIKKLKEEVAGMLPQDYSPIDGDFVEELVERVDTLSDTAQALYEYADDMSSGPIGNLKHSFQSVRKQVNDYIAGKEILNVDADENVDAIWSLPAFHWEDQPNLAYYSGKIGAKNPKTPNSNTQQLIRDTREIQRKAELAMKLKTRAIKDKEQQISVLSKVDALKSKAAGVADNPVPLLAHRIKKLSKKL